MVSGGRDDKNPSQKIKSNKPSAAVNTTAITFLIMKTPNPPKDRARLLKSVSIAATTAY
jgi:hypothetical protein